MDYFYDGQIRRYLTQFIRMLSGFQVQIGKDAQGAPQYRTVPARYGNMSKQVAGILKNNSENMLNSVPLIAAYVQDMQMDRTRMQDPTFVSKVHIRERDFDGTNYTATQGPNFTVERLMPTPYMLTLKADIWTSNQDQKLQLMEQMLVLFRPSLELQTTDNYLDWTSLSTVELTGVTYSNQIIPVGDQAEIEVCSLTFQTPIWLTTPAKVKKMGLITSIIARMFDEEGNYSDDIFAGVQLSKQTITDDNLGIILNHSGTYYYAELIGAAERTATDFQSKDAKRGIDRSWRSFFEKYPGRFNPNLTEIRFTKPNGLELVGTINGINPLNENELLITFNTGTFPSNTDLTDSNSITRGTIDAIIDPSRYEKKAETAGTRYLILEDIIDADNDLANQYRTWPRGFTASASDIIVYTGTTWEVLFNSSAVTTITYITNVYTGLQYKWDPYASWLASTSYAKGSLVKYNGVDYICIKEHISSDTFDISKWQITSNSWIKSVEGTYRPGDWRIVL